MLFSVATMSGVRSAPLFIGSSNMKDQWYFAWDKERHGPFSAAQLKELGALGKVQPTDTVWKEGIEKGVLAAQVKDLFPDPPAEALPAKETVTVANEPGTLDEQLQEIVPDGLMLTVIPEQTDLVFADSPALINSPGSYQMEAQALKASRAITNHYQPPVRKGRAIAVKGAVIIGQDGGNVQYRKKCSKCAYEDTCRSSMPIRNGVSRQRFFCPKCRKLGEVVIQGIT